MFGYVWNAACNDRIEGSGLYVARQMKVRRKKQVLILHQPRWCQQSTELMKSCRLKMLRHIGVHLQIIALDPYALGTSQFDSKGHVSPVPNVRGTSFSRAERLGRRTPWILLHVTNSTYEGSLCRFGWHFTAMCFLKVLDRARL